MKTIILPGYSPKNKEWAVEIQKALKLDHEVLVHEWKHWVSGSFSSDYEIKTITRKVGNDKFNVIAKSVGTSIAMHLIEQNSKNINYMILCGIPLKNFSKERKDLFRNNLAGIKQTNIIIFQNKNDYFGSYDMVEKFIHQIRSGIKTVEKERSDHHYPYPKDFKEFLKGDGS